MPTKMDLCKNDDINSYAVSLKRYFYNNVCRIIVRRNLKRKVMGNSPDFTKGNGIKVCEVLGPNS